MTKLHPSQKMQDDAVEKLSNQMVRIIREGMGDKDNTEILTEAIACCFQSLERFDKIFYSLLTEEEIAEIGLLIDEAVTKKLSKSQDVAVSQRQYYEKQKHPFAHVFNSTVFKAIVHGLRSAQAGMAQAASAGDIVNAPTFGEIKGKAKPQGRER